MSLRVSYKTGIMGGLLYTSKMSQTVGNGAADGDGTHFDYFIGFPFILFFNYHLISHDK